MVLLDDLEHRLAIVSERLGAAPALRSARDLAEEDFHDLLLQRRFVSLAFTPFYDTIIDALDDDEARLVCRQILREEYPGEGGNSPSHREQLVADLLTLGIQREDLLASRPTAATVECVAESFQLVFEASAEQCRDVALIATAACYGEALVQAEYMAMAPRIERVVPLPSTVFFGPHVLHDGGHAKRLLEEARSGMDGDPELRAFDAALNRCLAVKLRFYAQFGNPVAIPAASGPVR